ncbi:hypothetical protein [Methanoregula sp.]|uniref:hypothetical protein n=1 Tax=Methanoregula sp. TaxID=2052170 RepID=UPI0035618BEE
MDSRNPVLIIFLVLGLLVAASGCTTNPAQQTLTTTAGTNSVSPEKTAVAEIPASGHTLPAPASGIAAELAAVKSDSVVWKEAYRMFRNIKSTEYVHPPYTDDDAAGIYKFDCLGFVDHVLMNATPAAYREIGKGVNPSIESYAATFGNLNTKSPIALLGTRVDHPHDLQPGDICLWLKPSTFDTGHMWIIAGEPKVNPKRTDEVLVRIFDSTGTVHTADSRAGSVDKTGLGSGILGFMVDGEGSPTGLYWEGGASTGAGEKDTTIVCGRLNR